MESNDVIVAEPISHRHYFAVFLWVFLGFLYVSLLSQWITVNNRDKMFTDYIDHVLQSAATEQTSAKEVRALLLIKAGDLSLPLHGDELQVNGNGQTLRAAVQYKADISLPIVNQPVYRMRFQHDRGLR
jgi:hypothetical protein